MWNPYWSQWGWLPISSGLTSAVHALKVQALHFRCLKVKMCRSLCEISISIFSSQQNGKKKMKTSVFDLLGYLTWQSLTGWGDKVTFLILYSFNRFIIISSNGKQAISTVNNLPGPQGTALQNGGNSGKKLKIFSHNLLWSWKEKMYLWKWMSIHISSRIHHECRSLLKR